jgi:RimJ/RimL family protein N-acetyltransferase
VSLAALQLRTLFTFDGDGHLVATRESHPAPAPRLFIVRTFDEVAWATQAEAPDEVVRLAQTEPPLTDLRRPPVHADRYVRLLGDEVESGPAFTFPVDLELHPDVVRVEEYAALRNRFAPDEIAGRSPIYAVIEDGIAVSFCHCARSSDQAAEAGLFTEPLHRGHGLGTRVTASWAAAIRAEGRTPIYSTSWDNTASLAVARKLGLVPFGSDFSVV